MMKKIWKERSDIDGCIIPRSVVVPAVMFSGIENRWMLALIANFVLHHAVDDWNREQNDAHARCQDENTVDQLLFPFQMHKKRRNKGSFDSGNAKPDN